MSAPLTREDWDARPGGRLRGVLVWLPALLFAFAYVGGLVLAVLLRPAAVRRHFHRLAPPWGRVLLALFGIRLEVHGRERLDVPGQQIVLFNHQSLLDLCVLAVLWPRNGVVVYKQEFHAIPLFGRLFRGLGMIAIDRRDRTAAIASLHRAAESIAEHGAKVLLSPEGTRSRVSGLLPFKRGPFHVAAATGAPIVPMVMRGVRAVMPARAWVARSGRVRVDLLEPIDTRGWTTADLDEHMQAVREVFLRYVPPASEATGRSPTPSA